jgi:transmembrane sensor
MEEELIVRCLSGEASVEEEQKLHAWIALRPENEQRYLASKKVFELSNQHYAVRGLKSLDINVDQEWNHFVNKIERKKEAPEYSIPVGQPTFAGNWLRMAASIALIVMSGAAVYYFVKDNDVHYQTTNSPLTISLPDGSQVILNTNSELSYSTAFGAKNRLVKLSGEGFFRVERDEQKPFVIDVNKTKVEVLGTSFDVQGYEDAESVEVVVQTGVVKFSAPATKREVTLTAGQKGIYSKTKQHLNSFVNEDPNFLSWNTQTIVFTDSNLRTVIETLNRTYHANIVATSEIPASCVVTVTFDHQTLEAVLNVLKTTLNLTYRINSNRIEITHAGC